MAQHFLLSAAARTLSLKEIYKAGEAVAYETFCKLRWPETDGEAVCPRCGCCDTYSITTRRKFKCKACYHQFSVTSGTIFASRKLDFTDLLAAICLFVSNAKGMSSIQFSRTLDVQYKTAWVMAHKLREALGSEVDGETLDGEVEIDGAYFGGHIRPENEKANRKDRRLTENQTGLRRVVIALRERGGRTLSFVGKKEIEGVAIAKAVVDHGSMMFADEGSHWDLLDTTFECGRINHWVESYFSRLRRMVTGQHHFVSPKYLPPVRNTRRLDRGPPRRKQQGPDLRCASQRAVLAGVAGVQGVLAAGCLSRKGAESPQSSSYAAVSLPGKRFPVLISLIRPGFT